MMSRALGSGEGIHGAKSLMMAGIVKEIKTIWTVLSDEWKLKKNYTLLW